MKVRYNDTLVGNIIRGSVQGCLLGKRFGYLWVINLRCLLAFNRGTYKMLSIRRIKGSNRVRDIKHIDIRN